MDGMRLGGTGVEEYDWLLQHGNFQGDLGEYVRIAKEDGSYYLAKVNTARLKPKRIGSYKTLKALCSRHKLDIIVAGGEDRMQSGRLTMDPVFLLAPV